jgi:hypothetical protein
MYPITQLDSISIVVIIDVSIGILVGISDTVVLVAVVAVVYRALARSRGAFTTKLPNIYMVRRELRC